MSGAAFGASGFGGVTIPLVHDSPSKLGFNAITPAPCPTVVTNVATVTAQYGDTTVTATDNETVQVTAPATGGVFTTYTQGGWGAKPHGNNPGALLAANFSRVYPGGSVVIGGNFTLTFTSAGAIEKFLPQGSQPRALTQSYVDPKQKNLTVLAGQVLTLRLNVDFSAAGILQTGLGSLTVVSGPLAGMTVNQVLALGNAVLGGNTAALPAGASISTLNDVITSINENFDEGRRNNGFLH